MKRYTIPAELERLEKVKACIDRLLQKTPSSEEERMAIEIAVEEIFVNIVKYADISERDEIELRFDYKEGEKSVLIQFRDDGVCFNPLENEEPEIQTDLSGREPGGLGIYMVKRMMDDIRYEHREGKNVLTLEKRLSDRREE